MKGIKTDRRAFIIKTVTSAAGSVLAAAIIGPAIVAEAAGGGMLGHGGTDGYVLGSAVTQHCGTCEFWGGPRRLSKDRKSITVSGLGWCNNPDSPNYEKMTSPETGPMTTWKKWSLLG
jgi:hypothetical protein